MARYSSNYSAVARILHWTIAILIGGQLIGGFVLGHRLVEGETLYDFMQLHKSFGLLVLILSTLRLIWRLMHRPPPLPGDMKKWEVAVSHITHVTFYVLMFAVPLAGWAYVSASPLQIPTRMFNLIPVPHLPFPVGADLAETMSGLHEFFAFAMMGLLALHVGAALKHSVSAGDKVMERMAGRGIGKLLAFALAALVVGGLVWVFAHPYDEEADAPTEVETAIVETDAVPEEDPAPEVQPALAETALPETSPSAAGTPVAPETTEQNNAWTIVPGTLRITAQVHAKQAKRHAYLTAATGTIILNRNDPAAHGRIDIVVDTHSLESDENMVKKLAAEASWMNIARYPEARFQSDTITRQDDGSYVAIGPLTLKETSIDVALPFTLEETEVGVKALGEITFDRSDFDIGISETDDTVASLTIELEAVPSGR